MTDILNLFAPANSLSLSFFCRGRERGNADVIIQLTIDTIVNDKIPDLMEFVKKKITKEVISIKHDRNLLVEVV